MSSERYHRREFVHAIVLGASAATLSARPVLGDEGPKPGEATPAEPSPSPKSEAGARMGLILARFGERLDDDARDSVRAEVGAIVRRAELLREFALDNGDGPFPVFAPYRAPLAR